MPILLTLLLLFGWTPSALAGATLAQSERPVEVVRRWETLVLPAGFDLDLRSGVVVSRPEPGSASLRYAGGRLSSATPLRLLPTAAGKAPSQFARDGGEAIPGVMPSAGQNLIFDCFGGAWGLVRILKVAPENLTIEFVLETDPAVRTLERLPSELTARSRPNGVTLEWPAQGGELHLIERRRIAASVGEAHGAWEEVARKEGGEWVDEDLQLARLSEYRVSLVGDGGHFGSIASGIPGVEPPQVRAQVGPGTELNLFSAIEDGLRTDLTIELIRSNGVQVLPGDGVHARMLTQAESENWHLTEVEESGYRKQHFFVPPGRTLALHLPEGIHCLLRVEEIGEQFVVLSRRLDLSGDLLFPPVPMQPQAQWEPERGVVFRFPDVHDGAPRERALVLIERERTLDKGDWETCVVGAAGELELVDHCDVSELLVRYRFRQGMNMERMSPSGEPLTILVGDDSDESRALLLKRAILDLGAADFSRRERARAVLVALGEGAWPLLREALRSDNAELASSARELLISGLREAGKNQEVIQGGLARLLLSIRAEELGLGRPPHQNWTSRFLGVRALACLEGLGWRATAPGEVTAWRRVLSESDPELGVRLVAGLASAFERQGLGPDLGFPMDLQSEEPGHSEVWPYASESQTKLTRRDPWTDLVEAQARHALDGAQAGSREEREHAEGELTLAHSLTAHFRRTGDDLFLDCALRLLTDPLARLRGALELAQARSKARASAVPHWRSVRLDAPQTELLEQELQQLKGGGGEPLEIILPAGVYEPLAGGGAIAVDGAEFRLRAEGEVELHVGFTLLKGCRAGFSGLSIIPDQGIAINVVQSELFLRDCWLEGGTLGLLGTDAIVEMEGCTVISPSSAGVGAAGLRFGGRSMLLASATRIECPGVAISGLRAALLDRCVVISTHRNAIEGGTSSDLWALACLIQAEKAPYLRMTRGVLEGVCVVGDLNSSLDGNLGVRLCAEHMRCDAELAEFESELWLGRCCLSR
ncbi:MAG: hypothetical protein ACI9F9_000982 [Candidatus Paceibacteria bacterium]|jgi:hypothetical protein